MASSLTPRKQSLYHSKDILPRIKIQIHESTCLAPVRCRCPLVEEVGNHRFLGPNLDSGLSYGCHVDRLCSNIRKGLAIMVRVRSVCLKRTACDAVIESHVAWMLSMYGGTAEFLTDRIFRSQKRLMRLVADAHYLASIGPGLYSLSGPPSGKALRLPSDTVG